ncbi:SpoIIE family protein phosphatase [bacterium]|nr:SpoIIE family protein phosphatase [bacterium]
MGDILTESGKPKILVADDEQDFLNQTKDCLEENGYEVLSARDGKEALAIARKDSVDLVILDIIMPVLNGVEVAKSLRLDPQTKEIPIIIVSSMTEYKDRVEFFRIGANDYMPKPIDSGELLARVALQLQLVHLRRQLEETNEALTQKNQMLERHVSRIEQDLALARSVQRSLLPATVAQFPNLSVHTKHLSSENLGSDFIDYLQDEEGTLHFIIADVSGHGIASALLAAQLKVVFMATTQRKLSAKQFMNQINKLSVLTLSEGYYYTAIYLLYDSKANSLEVVNAGHVPLLYLQQSSGEVKQIESKNAPLGFFEQEEYEVMMFNPSDGDVLLLLTDGLTEHTNSNNDMFDVARVMAVLKQSGNDPPQELIDREIKEALEFGNSPMFKDDVTMAVLCFGPNGSTSAEIDAKN